MWQRIGVRNLTQEEVVIYVTVSNSRSSLEIRKPTSSISKSSANVEELKDDVPLISFIQSTKASTKRKGVGIKNIPKSTVSQKFV
ncbi:hypothetical protein GBA52_020499 [Prunus armeniaca]|nr:hypothetical protein GBA52_020499 [Prunus armeniaca]